MKTSLFKTFFGSKHIPRPGNVSSVPGTVEYVGKKREDPVSIHVLDYKGEEFQEKDFIAISETLPLKESSNLTWINVTGVHDEVIIREIGDVFKIHPLVLEDITNTTQRPKVEEYDDYIFVITKMAYFDKKTSEIITEQVSLIIGENYVISLQEKKGDILEGLRERIRKNKGRVRRSGSDYLMYCILDSIVDHYFLVLEHVGGEIEEMETALLLLANQDVLNKIYRLKQELVFLRKSIWPMREVVSILQRADHDLMQDYTSIYLRDVYDHTVQVVETVETFRDMASGMLDLYLSTVSNRMNEVMKVLTIFAAIFIPLTFIAGVYGMNFEFMPELKWRLAYPVWWVVTITLTICMVLYFKRRKWL